MISGKGIMAQPVGDTVVWRAGNQMIKRYGAKAAMEAAMRSNAALEIGDTFNYELWQWAWRFRIWNARSQT
jgi:hypothetical protein